MKNISFFGVALIAMLGIQVGCTSSCKGNTKANTPASPAVNDQAKAATNKQLKKEMVTLMEDLNLKQGDKLYADFETSMGKVRAELFWDKAPVTVLNFVQLAQGKKEWTHPKTQETLNKPLYDNTIFHRVIKDFMIQGGDPMGSGFGGPGFRFKDEFHPELRHNAKGILSMANSGPNTNGSQFFITEVATPHLDNRHTVFGKVEGSDSLDIISKIADVKTKAGDKPETDVVLKTVKITKG